MVKLREVSPTERLIFDLAAAVFAVFFIVVWLFVFFNDKLFGGMLLKRAVMVRDALVARDLKSADIIKPFLRGRDVKRWNVEFEELYLTEIVH